MLAIYVRLSIDDEDSNSIENQMREGEAYATKTNAAFEIYDEGKGVSGRDDIKDRPELDRLLKDIASKKITSVWMRNQNRLERNSATFHVFASLVKKYKIKVVFGDKEMDWNDPSNFLQSSILTAINSYQAELQSYQTKKSLLDNAREGKAFGVTPFGYMTDDKGYFTINEEEADIVRRIYKLSLEGIGTRSIADKLNEEGIATRYAKMEGTITVRNKDTGKITTRNKSDVRWAGNTVRGIITNSLYKGERKWGENIFEIPAIFKPNYWQKVNDNLAQNSNNKGLSVEHKYMLKGVLECGRCGRNYYGRTRTNKKDNYYMCSSKRYKDLNCENRSINIDVLESLLWNLLFGNRGLEKKIRNFKSDKGYDLRRKELEKNIESYHSSLADLQKQKGRAIRLVINGTLSEEEVKIEKTRIVRSENDIKERLAKDNEELSYFNEGSTSLEELINYYIDGKALKKDGYKSVVFIQGDFELSDPDILCVNINNPPLNLFKSTFSWNEKRDLIKRYLNRVFVRYNGAYKMYTLEITYNLPVANDTIVVDANYLHAYNVNQSKFIEIGIDPLRYFTKETVERVGKEVVGYLGYVAGGGRM